METFKDILYKKNDNETWTEWNNRLPTNDDKLDYIGETIYNKCIWGGKETVCKITDILLELGIEKLIPLLENEDLLEEKLEEAYRVVQKVEVRKVKGNKVEGNKVEVNKVGVKKTNKNGYLIMASEGLEDYYRTDYVNEPYGYSLTLEDAREIAIEAICYGTKRDEKWRSGSEGGFEESEIINLDNMKKIRLSSEELEYYRKKSKPDMWYKCWDDVNKQHIYYTKEEQDDKLTELYEKMIEAKKKFNEENEIYNL